jgi:predicted small secreted protein
MSKEKKTMKKISLVFMLVVLGAVLLTGCDGWDVTVGGDLVKEYAGTYVITESLYIHSSYINGVSTVELVPKSREELAESNDTIVIKENGDATIHYYTPDSPFQTEVSYDGTVSVNKSKVNGHAGNSVLIFTFEFKEDSDIATVYTYEFDSTAKTLTYWLLSDAPGFNVDGVQNKQVYTLI